MTLALLVPEIQRGGGGSEEPPPQSKERMGFSVFGSLITVPLHSTLAVNNLGLKFVS